MAALSMDLREKAEDLEKRRLEIILSRGISQDFS
jgi:hypothetical protein